MKRNAIREDIRGFAIPAIIVYSAGLAVSAWDLVKRPESLTILSVHSILGVVLVAIGLTLMVVAVGTLRRFYSATLVVREDHRLITHGVYRYVRHPLYLGVGMKILGVPILASSLYGFLITLVLIPLLLNRIRIEERLLTDEFGDEYDEYKRATKKLIPFIY